MTDIKFTRRESALFDRIITPSYVLGKDTIAVLNLAFEHGGYIAGGFARFALAVFYNPEVRQNWIGDADCEIDRGQQRIHHYLRIGDEIQRAKHFWKARGDIDLFFPDQPRFDAFLRKCMALCHQFNINVVDDSPNVIELECNGRSLLIQIVRRFLGPIEEQLSHFDIYNAMVAFNDKELIMAEGWIDLDMNQMLHVHNWTSPYVVQRLNK